MKIAGLDIGTTGCKFTVFDEVGNCLDTAYRDYPVSRAIGCHEVNVSAITDAVLACICELTAKYDDIAGIGITSFGETFVCTDEEGTPLFPAMLYTDPRGKEECEQLVEALGSEKIAAITGLRAHEMYSISKIMWVKNHHPEVYENTKHILLMVDFVAYHLTRVAQIDYSLATRTMAFDIQKLTWSNEILEAAGIDATLLSKPVPTGTTAGTVTAEVAAKTGLSPETVVVTVSHDQIAAAVGAGAFDGKTAVDGAGTVECLTPIYDELPDVTELYKGYFAAVPYVIPGKYVAYAFSYTGGALMQWCTECIAKKEKELAKEAGLSVNAFLEQAYAEAHGEAPSGLLVLPHFAGAATPYMDTGSKGAILGMTTATTASDIYRACMEGVVYEMYLNYERLSSSGLHFEKMNATGGGAHSKVWMQMKADMLNVPVVALETTNAGTVGCAMLTGVAAGMFRDLEEATNHMVKETVTYYPRAEMHEKYMAYYEKYKKLYEAVRPLV